MTADEVAERLTACGWTSVVDSWGVTVQAVYSSEASARMALLCAGVTWAHVEDRKDGPALVGYVGEVRVSARYRSAS